MADRIQGCLAFVVDIDMVACLGDSDPQVVEPHLLEEVEGDL